MTARVRRSRYVPGDRLPLLQTAPISRATLALFAGASNDHNPVHIDLDAARAAGMDDVFAQGMLPMAYLGRVLTGAFGAGALREFGVRFAGITRVRDRLECVGEVTAVEENDAGQRLTLRLAAIGPRGDPVVVGEAIVEIEI